MLPKRALLLSSLVLAQRQGYDNWPECQPVDITFILDGSKSIKRDYFDMSVDVAKYIVKLASRQNGWNRFAVMQFSHGKNTLELQMNRANEFGYANDPFHNQGTILKEKQSRNYKHDVLKELNNVKKRYHSGHQTRVGSGLWKTRTTILENPNDGSDIRRRQLVFLISDGKKHDWPKKERERYDALLTTFPGDSKLIGILNGKERSEQKMKRVIGADKTILEIGDYIIINSFLETGRVPSTAKKLALEQLICGEAFPATTQEPTTTPATTTTTITTTEETTTPTTIAATECPALATSSCSSMSDYSPACARLDITFVLDESAGITNDRHTKTKEFINWVVETAASLNANNRFSVHRFSTTGVYSHGLRFGKSWEKYSFTNGNANQVNNFLTCLKADEYKDDILNNNMKPTTTTNPQSIIFGTKLSSSNSGHQADIYEGLKKVKYNILDQGRTQDLNTRHVIFLITQGNLKGCANVGKVIAGGLKYIKNGLEIY
jgi:hypothetical protein